MISSAARLGLTQTLITVEAALLGDFPVPFHLLGLSGQAAVAAQVRVRAAIEQSGYAFPQSVGVSLLPLSFLKEDRLYDLPMALAILAASGQLAAIPSVWEEAIFVGELALSGHVGHVKGVYPLVRLARAHGKRKAFVPAVDAAEAALVGGITVYPVESLQQVVAHLEEDAPITPFVASQGSVPQTERRAAFLDLAEVRGHNAPKRALEVAAAGCHPLLLVGPPGAGKTLLAQTLPGVLPPLSQQEAEEVTSLASLDGEPISGLVEQRPFRAPAPTTTYTQMVGSGRVPCAGELSRAHGGVLFLDDLTRFRASVLYAVRHAVETKQALIRRGPDLVVAPASFLLVASCQPCSCGFYGDPHRECTCSFSDISLYQRRISRLLGTCFPMQISVPPPSPQEMRDTRRGEASAVVRERVEQARKRAARRFQGTGFSCNEELGQKAPDFCPLEGPAQRLLQAAITQLHLSLREEHQLLRVARTIADLAESEEVRANHMAEAIMYRSPSAR